MRPRVSMLRFSRISMSCPPGDVRHQGHEPRALDRLREQALVLAGETRALARPDLALRRHEALQVLEALVVERLLRNRDLLGLGELRELAAATAAAWPRLSVARVHDRSSASVFSLF